MEIIVLHNQSILDASIQHTGSVENCFSIAIANGISVSDVLGVGSKMEISETVNNNDILNYYTAKKVQPATGTTDFENSQIPVLKGIGYMEIERTFKVE